MPNCKMNPKKIFNALSCGGETEICQMLDDKAIIVGEKIAKTELYPLSVAALKGNLAAIKTLVKHGADVSQRDSRGMTALTIAAQLRNQKATLLLITLGADTEMQDDGGNNIFHYLAIDNLNSGTIKALGSDNVLLFSRNNHGRTPLHMACVSKAEQCVKTITDMGGNPNARDLSGLTPLDIARSEGLPLISSYLLSKTRNTTATKLSKQVSSTP